MSDQFQDLMARRPTGTFEAVLDQRKVEDFWELGFTRIDRIKPEELAIEVKEAVLTVQGRKPANDGERRFVHRQRYFGPPSPDSTVVPTARVTACATM